MQKRDEISSSNTFHGSIQYDYTISYCASGQYTLNNACVDTAGWITVAPGNSGQSGGDFLSCTAPCSPDVHWRTTSGLGGYVTRNGEKINDNQDGDLWDQSNLPQGSYTYDLFVVDGYGVPHMVDTAIVMVTDAPIPVNKTASLSASGDFGFTPSKTSGSGTISNSNATNGGSFTVTSCQPISGTLSKNNILVQCPIGESVTNSKPFSVSIVGNPSSGSATVQVLVTGENGTTVNPLTADIPVSYTVTVSPISPTPTPTPTGGMSLSADPSTIDPGGSSSLFYSVPSDAQYPCAVGTWNGSTFSSIQQVNYGSRGGVARTGALYNSTTYHLRCPATGTTDSYKAATVNVTQSEEPQVADPGALTAATDGIITNTPYQCGTESVENCENSWSCQSVVRMWNGMNVCISYVNNPICTTTEVPVYCDSYGITGSWADPISGNAPLSGVELKYSFPYSWTSRGASKIKFECNDSKANTETVRRDNGNWNWTQIMSPSNICNYSSGGEYTAKATVYNDNDAILGSDTAIIAVTVPLADLTSGAPTITYTDDKHVSIANVSGLIRNISGKDVSSSFSNKLQIDTNNNGTVNETMTSTLSSLSANTSVSKLYSGGALSALSAGTHAIRYCADLPPDPNGSVAESNESNNCGEWSVFTLSENKTCPAGAVTLSSNTVSVGGTITAFAPSGFSGGSFVSSDSGVASVSGNKITARRSGTARISGIGWNHSNGAVNCSLDYSSGDSRGGEGGGGGGGGTPPPGGGTIVVTGESVNGLCGTANKTYPAGSTSYGSDTYCATGNPSSTPSFPPPGGSVIWTCNGLNGGTNSGQCTASVPLSQYSLTVTKTSGGSVTSSDGSISCGGTCSHNYTSGTSVTLTAIPSSSAWKFTGWSGACSGTASCILTINGAKTVNATFAPRDFNYQEF